MDIYFVSKNRHKIQEVKKILDPIGINIISHDMNIEEIQTSNVEDIVKDKVLKAFQKIGQRVFVEHTGLYIKSLEGFPGGLTQVFWDTIKADKFCQVVGSLEDKSLTAKTIIGYCNTKIIEIFEGEIQGTVPSEPRGSRDFQWDCVFIPDGYQETFAELGEEKNKISMRLKALQKFAEFIKEEKRNE